MTPDAPVPELAARRKAIVAAIPLMPQREIKNLLLTLRLDADMAWVNHFGEHVWMKALIRDRRCIGITECCGFDMPCERHAALASPAAAPETEDEG